MNILYNKYKLVHNYMNNIVYACVCVGLYNYRPCLERGSRFRYRYYATR